MSTTIIKAISLHQPWVSLISMGLKKYETRSWARSYRRLLLTLPQHPPLSRRSRLSWLEISSWLLEAFS
ncbi:hypothetical protein [Nostoc sp. CCY 9925]|uniref:hypothetical protein n=1 Tax=Nostoc sp. CCY 9925 TaxID=3103865 RepID=UPI0039C6DCE3